METPYKIRLKIHKDAYPILRDAGYKLCVSILVTDRDRTPLTHQLVPTIIDIEENMKDIPWEPPRSYAISYATEYPQIAWDGNLDDVVARVAKTVPQSIKFGEQFDVYKYGDGTVGSQDDEHLPVSNGFRFNNRNFVGSALLYRQTGGSTKFFFQTQLSVPGSGSIIPHERRALLWFATESKGPIVSTKHESYTGEVNFKDEDIVSADPSQGIETVYYSIEGGWSLKGFPKEDNDPLGGKCGGVVDDYQNKGFNAPEDTDIDEDYQNKGFNPPEDTNGAEDYQNEGFQDADNIQAKTDAPQLPNGTISSDPVVMNGIDKMTRSDLVSALSLILGKLQTTAIAT